jgi:hypothetical protein
MMKYDCNLCSISLISIDSPYITILSKNHPVNNDGETGGNKNDVTILSPLCNPNVTIMSPKCNHLNISNHSNKQRQNVYECSYCGRNYKYRQGKSRHLKVCKKKIEYEKELEELKKTNKELKKNNKELKENNKKIVNNTNINNSNNTNNIQNNIINIVPLGKEELQSIFTDDEQVEVLKRQYNSLQHLIFKIYNDEKFSKYRNVAIKNMKDDYAYQYNECNDDFELVSKSAVILDLINEHTMTIQHFLDYNAGKLSKRVLNRLNTFLNTIEDINTKTYKDNVEAINILLYNATKRYKVIMNLQ